jgi:hypothetical protein
MKMKFRGFFTMFALVSLTVASFGGVAFGAGPELYDTENSDYVTLRDMLGIAAGNVKEVSPAESIRTDGSIFSSNSDISKRASAAVSARQSLGTGNAGGALVLGSSITLPINTASFDGTSLPYVDDLNSFKARYSVLKFFETDATVDLLETYPQIFTFDNGGINLNATIVVI